MNIASSSSSPNKPLSTKGLVHMPKMASPSKVNHNYTINSRSFEDGGMFHMKLNMVIYFIYFYF